MKAKHIFRLNHFCKCSFLFLVFLNCTAKKALFLGINETTIDSKHLKLVAQNNLILETEPTLNTCKKLFAKTKQDAYSTQNTLEALFCKQVFLDIADTTKDKFCDNLRANKKIVEDISQNTNYEQSNSLGYLISDKDYSILNADKISLDAALPTVLNFQSIVESTQKNAQNLFLNLLEAEDKTVAFEKIKTAIEAENSLNLKNNLQIESRVGLYFTKLTKAAGNPPNLYVRFVSLKKTPACTYLVSTVPSIPKQAPTPFNSFSVHTVCKNDFGKFNSYLFNWRAALPRSFQFEALPAIDGNCFECHSGKSAFIPLEVDTNRNIDQGTKNLVESLLSKESFFQQRAELSTQIFYASSKTKEIQNIVVPNVTKLSQLKPVVFPKHFRGDNILNLRRQNSFLPQNCNIPEPKEQEKISKEMNVCINCHGGFTEDSSSPFENNFVVAPPRAIKGAAAYWPYVLSKHHFANKFHGQLSEKTFTCLLEEHKLAFHTELWENGIETLCATK